MADPLEAYRQQLLQRGLGDPTINRMVESRRQAERDVSETSGFGANILDRLLGAGSAAGYGLMGGVTDIAGNLGAFLGGPFTEDAATLEQFSDEAYRRALPLLTEGYKAGSIEAGRDAVPMFLFEERQMADAARRSEEIGGDLSIFANEFAGLGGTPTMSPQEMANMITALEGRAAERVYSGRGDGAFMELPGQRERALKAQQERIAQEEERKAQSVDAAIDKKMDSDMSASEKAFKAAMAEVRRAAGKEDADLSNLSEADLIEKYKQEFADATGLDISGKPDKSAALMAFGLALMQNRAGKGFNVGNILRSIGEAGEKALPEIKAAKQEARAAGLAAGKYAMDRIAARRDATAAMRLEKQKFVQDVLLKQMELDAEIAKEGRKPKDMKNVRKIDVLNNNSLVLERGLVDNVGVFVDGSATGQSLAKAYDSNYRAIDKINEIYNSVRNVADSPSPSLSLVADNVNSILVGMGLKDANVTFGDDGLSDTAKREVLTRSILTEFKRAITQETGNGISNRDIEDVFKAFGKLDIIGNPQEALFALTQMKGIFESNISAIDSYIDLAIEPDQFANETEYKRAVSLLPNRIRNQIVENPDGSFSVDLTSQR